MTSNNETVSCKSLQGSNIAKSMKSEGNGALLHTNIDQRPTFQVEFTTLFSMLFIDKLRNDRFQRKTLSFVF